MIDLLGWGVILCGVAFCYCWVKRVTREPAKPRSPWAGCVGSTHLDHDCARLSRWDGEKAP